MRNFGESWDLPYHVLVWSDCTGQCGGSTQYIELFLDGDGDHLGGASQDYYCMTSAMIVTANDNSWVSTGGDFDDECPCSANDPDVGGACLDECSICGGSGPQYMCEKTGQSYCSEAKYQLECMPDQPADE